MTLPHFLENDQNKFQVFLQSHGNMEPQGITLDFFDDMASVSSRPDLRELKYLGKEPSFRKKDNNKKSPTGRPPLPKSHHKMQRQRSNRKLNRNTQSNKNHQHDKWATNQNSIYVPSDTTGGYTADYRSNEFDKPRRILERKLSLQEDEKTEQNEGLGVVRHHPRSKRSGRKKSFEKPRTTPKKSVSLYVPSLQEEQKEVDFPEDEESSCVTMREVRQPGKTSAPKRSQSVQVCSNNNPSSSNEDLPRVPKRSTSIHVPNQDKKEDRFVPRRKKSIHAGFSKRQNNSSASSEQEDIWVERIVLSSGNQAPKTYFRSLRTHVCRREPPTGATTIIYLEDVFEREEHQDENDTAEETPTEKQEEPATKEKTKMKKGKWKSILRMVKPKKSKT